VICLYWLDSGTRRFNELRRLMPQISHKVLAATLRNLEHQGLIGRTVYAEAPPRVEYCISGHGETVRPLIQAVRTLGPRAP
jgi:DNA-binding HxlR family transcriptional regulator